VEAERVPVDESAAVVARARGREALDLALHGGDEYQLLLAVPEERAAEAAELALVWHVTLTDIGEFKAGPPEVFLRSSEGVRALPPQGHDHFAGQEDPAPGLPAR
jgi:thiamine-monophosphate kinase